MNMIKQPFMKPQYGRLLCGQQVILIHCNPMIEDAIRDLFQQQGAKIMSWDGISEIEADVLVCGMDQENNPALGEWTSTCLNDTQKAITKCITHMKEQTYGTIVQIGAPYGKYCVPGTMELAVVSESLGALIRCVAMEYCRYNIRANQLLLPYSMVKKMKIRICSFCVVQERQRMWQKKHCFWHLQCLLLTSL